MFGGAAGPWATGAFRLVMTTFSNLETTRVVKGANPRRGDDVDKNRQSAEKLTGSQRATHEALAYITCMHILISNCPLADALKPDMFEILPPGSVRPRGG